MCRRLFSFCSKLYFLKDCIYYCKKNDSSFVEMWKDRDRERNIPILEFNRRPHVRKSTTYIFYNFISRIAL